jgi:hypothetical protein
LGIVGGTILPKLRHQFFKARFERTRRAVKAK